MLQPVMLVFREGTNAGVLLRLPSLANDVFCSVDSRFGYIHTPIKRRFQEVLEKEIPELRKPFIRCRSFFSTYLENDIHAILQTKQRNIWILWCCVLGILSVYYIAFYEMRPCSVSSLISNESSNSSRNSFFGAQCKLPQNKWNSYWEQYKEHFLFQ